MGNKPASNVAYDPREMFAVAERYGIARMHLATHPAIGAIIEPWIILSALSLEIFFKCLIVLDGNTYSGIHDLVGLFGATSKRTQQEITAAHQKYLPNVQKQYNNSFAHAGLGTAPTASLRQVLNDSNKAFVTIRYPYEKRINTGGVWMATEVTECVREIILKRKPEWSNMRHNVLRPPSGKP